MLQKNNPAIVCCGRHITPQEVKDIQETVNLFPNLSRRELSETICEHLQWYTASGKNKIDACMKLLEKLEIGQKIKLPAKKKTIRSSTIKKITITSRTAPQSEITGTLANLGKVGLEIVSDREQVNLWNEYVFRYHYLGYSHPFGCFIRYFITSEFGILGCILYSGSAKSMTARDRWIGWTKNQRLKNLAWVVNNSRFLILPWVNVKNLASHVLGNVSRSIRKDWKKQWNYSPVLMETFVDPQFYQGTCYQASNWQCIGMTTGMGLARKGKTYKTSPKKIYVKPLVKDFQSFLCSEDLNKEETDE